MKKLLAILKMKCPKCYKGNLYKDINPFHVSKLHSMPSHCDQCGQPFNPEPGFYMGAMYVSYGLCVLLFVICFFVLHIHLQVEAVPFLCVYAISLLIVFPFIFRYSRTIYLHLFYEHDPDAIEEYQKKKEI
ncbi:MAG TPA: DUF983 domain-containing protein [Cytophagaceae bacterium]|jgi:hypothetical protein|nr:DUF983 domain-containing protein [Cytophagaceae bacterium]